MDTPYEYYNQILGVRVAYLIQDSCAAPESLGLVKYNALYKRLESKTQPETWLRKASRGGGALVRFDSLYKPWRDLLHKRFGEPQTSVAISFIQEHYVYDSVAKDFFDAHRYNQNRKLPADVVLLYTHHASLLQAVLFAKANRKAYAKTLGKSGQIDIWDSLSRDINAFKDPPHDLPASKDGLRRKVTEFAKVGYSAIISGKYGTQNASIITDANQLAILEEILSKHQNLNDVQVATYYNTVGEALGYKPISSAVVARKRKELELYIHGGRRGKKSFENNIDMQNKRSKPSAAMLFWSVDGWNVELLYQKTVVDKKGNSVTQYHHRLVAVIILDPFNDYIIGYAIGERETPELVKQALRNAYAHTQELFGQRYKPYQIQSDNYGNGALVPYFSDGCRYYTPARVGNAKAKPIEAFFNRFNSNHFQAKLFDNWSGHNVTARAENQPNTEFRNLVKKNFPDYNQVYKQIEQAIFDDRQAKFAQYIDSFASLDVEKKTTYGLNSYLRTFGKASNYVNRFRGDGLRTKILGIERHYDTFDLSFRENICQDWRVYYDPDNLGHIMVTNAHGNNGRLIDEIGSLEYILEAKYVSPMALADQTEQDGIERQRINQFNKQNKEMVMLHNQERWDTIGQIAQDNLELETLQKILITNSRGQHKNMLYDATENQNTKAIAKLKAKEEKQQQKAAANDWKQQQENYLKEKINLNNYFDI